MQELGVKKAIEKIEFNTSAIHEVNDTYIEDKKGVILLYIFIC